MSASTVHTRTGLARKGRHRKPSTSTTGKTIAKTVVAGAVVGTPLATVSALTTPGTAQAASDTVWDRVAKCESGGNWSINTGNGFRGGLQFTSSTWRGFGGTQFASSAEKASREQQIVVAEKVLSRQGWGAWPVCSRKAKATGQSATLRIAPGKPKGSTAVTTKAVGNKTIGNRKASKPTPVATVTGRHALKPSGPNPLASPPPSVTSQPEVAPGAPPPTPILQVADRVQPLVTPPAPASPLSAVPLPAKAPIHESAKSPSGHASVAPPPAVAPPPTAPSASGPAASGPAAPAPRIPTPRRSPESVSAPAAPAPAPAAPRTYQVRAGDTLDGIARSQAVTGGWKSIYDANRGTLTDPNRIRPGQELRLS